MFYYALYFMIVTILICFGISIYKIYIRPRFPIKVTCWFCGERSTVAYDDANSFTCGSCEQYNGFNESGDYNKDIPAQYDELSNQPSSCQQNEFVGGDNVLCKTCTQNQLLKVKQLANFVPYNEGNFSWEADLYKQHLEKLYMLCLDCEQKVRDELETQNEIIATRYSNHQLPDESHFSQIHEIDLTQENLTLSTDESSTVVIVSRVLHILSLLCAASLLLHTVDIGRIQGLQDWCVMVHPLLSQLDRQAVTVAVMGMFAGVAAKLLLGKYRIRLVDVVCCPVWLIILLIQTQFIPATVMSPGLDLLCNVTNVITCLICAGVSRNRWDIPHTSINRSMSFRNRPGRPDIGTTSPRWTEEEEGEYTDDEEADNIDPAPDVGSLTDSLSGLGSWINKQQKNSGVFSSVLFASSPVHTSVSTSSSWRGGSLAVSQSHSRTGGSLSNSQSNTVKKRSASLNQTRSKIGGSISVSHSNKRKDGTALYSQADIKVTETPSPVRQRPLISPASFVHRSTPANHRFGRGLANNFGLFSPSTPPTSTSLICGYSLFTYRQPLFPPEKLAIQPKQSFGSSPYPDVQTKCKQETFERYSVSTVSVEKKFENSELYTVETQTQLTTETEAMEEDMVIDELVDRFLDMPILTQEPTPLRRSDSGFFSVLSENDSPQPSVFASLLSTSLPYTTLPANEPRPLIRTARFVYHSSPSTTESRSSFR